MPKLSNPLKAGIRTTEFAVLVVALVVLAVLPIVQGGLSPQHATQYGTTLAAVYMIARAIPKGLAALNGMLGIQQADQAKVEQVAGEAEGVIDAGIPILAPHEPQPESSVPAGPMLPETPPPAEPGVPPAGVA